MARRAERKYRPVRTPTVLQMEAVECGAAALGIILEYYGRYVPLDVLRDDCGVSRDGSNAYYIKEAARQYGLEMTPFRKPAKGLATKKPPLMVLWRWNHFLVVEGFARGRVFLNDPASGRRIVSRDEFERSYSGIAFSFTPGPAFEAEGRRPSTILGLARRLATSKSALAFVILAGLTLAIPTLVTASYQRIFIDEILVQGRFDWLRPLLYAMAATLAVRAAATALQQLYLTRLEIRLALTESVRFLQHVLRLPVTFFQYRFAGDVVSRIVSTARVARLISGELATTTVSLLTLLIFVAAMLPYDPLLTVAGVAISSVNLIALRWFSRWRTDQNRAIEQVRGRLAGSLMWAIQIIESVKATGSETDLMVRWTGEQAKVVSAEQELGAYDTLLIAMPALLATLTTVVVLGLGGRQVAVGSLSIGALVAFQTLLASFNQPFCDMGRLGAQVQELQADLDRIDDVRRHKPDPILVSRIAPLSEPRIAASPTTITSFPRLSGHLELKGVTFGYNRTVEEPLIKDFSLVIRPGQRVALVGGSGSGKTTLARLVVGLYQPWKGEILHDGKAIKEIPHEIFVNSVSLVDEWISMFQGTVRDNLTLWDEMVSTARVTHAGVEAAIHGELLQRRGGYDAVVAEGARNFSGGQRQRLEIARALVCDPSLLVLDEATSALDPKTEAIVDDQLRRRGCSCLIIAHRLSTIRDCDEIIVMSAGRVVQRGTHDQLIEDAEGAYYKLLADQSLPPRRAARLAAHFRMAGDATRGQTSTPQDPLAPTVAPHESPLSAPIISSAAGQVSPSEAIEPPRFLIEELGPYTQHEETAANRPLPLDDPESVWWVSEGQVDVFFTLPGLDGEPGRRRHLCRVEEGGSIFALRGVRGLMGGGLLAVGNGPARLSRFARGDLIRLSFEENLAEQVAVLIDDWILRVSRSLTQPMLPPVRQEIALSGPTDLPAGTLFGVREGVAWVRQLNGRSRFLNESLLPVSERAVRFPLSEFTWLTAVEPSSVSAIRTAVMVRSGDPWEGLMDFHRVVLDEIGRNQTEEFQEQWNELTRAVAGDRSRARWFTARLAAVANETETPIEGATGDDLPTACRAIGRELGVVVRQPRRTSNNTTPGSDGDTLEEIARASGFHIRQVTLPPDWVERGSGEPLLARLSGENNRPVALLPGQDRGRGRFASRPYDLFDPRTERRRPIDEEHASQIGATAWMFYRTLPDHRVGLGDLFRFSLPGIRRELKLVVAMAVLAGLVGLAIPIGSGVLIDQVIPEMDVPGLGRFRLLILCVFLAALAFSTTVFQVVEGLALLRIEGKLVPAVVPAVWDRLLRLPTRFFGQFSSGDLALRAMGLGLIFKKVSGVAASTLVTCLISLFNLALLFWYSWRLAIVCGLLLIAMLFVIVVMLLGQLRQESRIRKVEGKIIGFLLEIVGGITKLRTAGAESRAFARWAGHYAEQINLMLTARWYSNRLHLFLSLFPTVIAMVVYLGVIRLDPKQLSTGSFLAFSIALANVITAVVAVSYTLRGLLEILPLYERIQPVLEASPEFPAASIEPIHLAGSLALNSVSFRYPGHDEGPPVLDGVSLQVGPGEFVAIVGASGSGKSTVMRLLLGFETPGRGTITYDGRELTTLDLREVRRQVGVVLQHAQLMPGDIFSNIVGFSPGLTMEDAWQAARMTGLDSEIEQFPMRMHTLVGEGGGNLSGGQRQRLLIARAIVHRPRILMLDEATSALDNQTQALVTRSITRELRGVTRLVIAHRLSTIIDADRIYVMKQGRIVQVGQYHQLLDEPGAFRELVQRQSL